jgi:hypothetical protein
MEVFELGFDSRVFAPIRPSQLMDYKDAWMYFQFVGKYNYTVQQARLAGSQEFSYFRFPSNELQSKYNLGLRLYLKQFPQYASNLAVIVPFQY